MFIRDRYNDPRAFIGPYDNVPRLEIDDSQSRLKISMAELHGRGKCSYILSDLLDHSELYNDIHLMLMFRTIELMPSTNDDQNSGRVGVNNQCKISYGRNVSDNDFKATLLHEVQHIIQKVDKLGLGGNQEYEMQKISKGKQQRLERAIEIFQERNPDIIVNEKSAATQRLLSLIFDDPENPKVRTKEDTLIRLYNSLSGLKYPKSIGSRETQLRLTDNGLRKYLHLPGEIEARAVEARMNYTPEQRHAVHPLVTWQLCAEHSPDVARTTQMEKIMEQTAKKPLIALGLL